uniref:Uncharacterized protein n=1 Tax=Arundo donax TaxID=35708 RepID=A0A0A9FIA1_ARUDO
MFIALIIVASMGSSDLSHIAYSGNMHFVLVSFIPPLSCNKIMCVIQEPPWSASLLGPPCPWTAHQDHRQAWKDCWCLEEEINRPTLKGTACWLIFRVP